MTGWEFYMCFQLEKKGFNMKILIGDYEVDIKVRKTYHSRSNKEDLFYFLNTISCAFQNSSDLYSGNNGVICICDPDYLKVVAKEYEDLGNEIFKFLEVSGFYKDLEKEIKK